MELTCFLQLFVSSVYEEENLRENDLGRNAASASSLTDLDFGTRSSPSPTPVNDVVRTLGSTTTTRCTHSSSPSLSPPLPHAIRLVLSPSLHVPPYSPPLLPLCLQRRQGRLGRYRRLPPQALSLWVWRHIGIEGSRHSRQAGR